MLTPEDIKKLTDYQLEVFKEVFVTKEDFKNLKGSFDTLQTSVDAVIKDKVIRDTESTASAYRIKEIENWVDKAASKLDLEFRH